MKKILYIIAGLTMGLEAGAQIPFLNGTEPSFGNNTIKLASELFEGDYTSDEDALDILAISGDCTVYNKETNTFSKMKGNIYSLYPIQQGSSALMRDSSLTVFASVDQNSTDQTLGNGGGVFFFKIRRSKNNLGWKLVPTDTVSGKYYYFRNVNFSQMKGSIHNQDFVFVSDNAGTTKRFLVTEDLTSLKSGDFADTARYVYPDSVTRATKENSVVPAGTVISEFLSHGWPVEIDGKTGKMIGKVHRFGRGASKIIKSPTGTYYFTYPGNPSVLMKYQPYNGGVNFNSKFDFPEVDRGNNPVLYAYKQNADGTGGFTVPIAFHIDSIPNPVEPEAGKVPEFSQVFDSLLIAKEVALRAGATMFANIGDIAIVKDWADREVLLVSEKGVDDSQNMYTNLNSLAKHLYDLDKNDGAGDGHFSDPYGRVLAIPVDENAKLSTLTEGGAVDGEKFFSNPDKIETVVARTSEGYVLFVTVKENIPSTDKGRNTGTVPFSERTNEAYYFQFPSDGEQAIFLPINFVTNEVLPIQLTDYTLYMSGSKGTMLTSSSHPVDETSGNLFLTNTKVQDEIKYDTYLTVLNGYNGTDKSMIVAVRPANQKVITGLGSQKDTAEEQSFHVWPNPASSVLHVSASGDYSITDLSGNMVKTFSAGKSLDVSDLEKGMYFLKKAGGAAVKVVID